MVLSLEMSDDITPFTLTCTTTGAPPSDIVWSKDGVKIDICSNTSKYSLEQVCINRTTAEYKSVLTINDVGDNIVGNYSCSVHSSSATVEFKGK